MIQLIWFVIGAALGAVNFFSQWWAVERLSPAMATRTGVWIVVGVILRVVLIAGLLLIAARQGFWPVVLTLIGFWLARTAGLWWINR